MFVGVKNHVNIPSIHIVVGSRFFRPPKAFRGLKISKIYIFVRNFPLWYLSLELGVVKF